MKLLKRILKKEAGQALPMALVLLVLGGFLVVPTLGLMTTNLTANRQIDRNNLELYAADAGVENLLWNIQDDPGILPAEGTPKTINLQDQTINGMSTVTTTISNEGNHNYKITSTATSPGADGHNTEIVVYINCLNFTHLLEGAITSNGDLTIRNSTVTGNVYYADDKSVTGSTLDPPEPIQEEQTNWPTWDDLSLSYLDDVAGHDYTGPNPLFINTLSPCELGPLYRDGSLTIDNNTNGLTLTLNGTIYVTGNLIFGQSKNYTLNLNNQTIFVHGTEGATWAIDFPSNSITVIGSGCIIAAGNIRFMPGMSSNDQEYVLVMSLTGKTYMKPGGPFYGSLVGDAEVEIQNGTLTWTDPYDHDLNFPDMDISGVTPSSSAGVILSYSIK
jgi:hypothetical protein